MTTETEPKAEDETVHRATSRVEVIESAMTFRATHLFPRTNLQMVRRTDGTLILSTGRDRILIVTGNSLANAELVFGAAAAGVPVCPVSPQYAMGVAGQHGPLLHVVGLLQPTIVFAEQVGPIAAALRKVLPDEATVICTDPQHWPGAVDWQDVRCVERRRSGGAP